MKETTPPPFAFGSTNKPGFAKMVEEQGELLQIIGKMIMVGGSYEHWSGDLRQPLLEELADVMASISFFATHNFDSEERKRLVERWELKLALFSTWHVEGDNPVPNTNPLPPEQPAA